MQKHFNNRYERRNYNNISRHTNAVRNNLAQCRNHHIAHYKHGGGGKPHADAVYGRGGNRQGGAHAEHQHKGGIFGDNAVFKPFKIFIQSLSLL